jgi:ketosteroid isomerase-like protein
MAVAAEVVRAFYDALNNKDAETLVTIVDGSFRPDAVVEWPKGLPMGGRVEGSARLKKIFAAAARSRVPAGPGRLDIVAILAGGDAAEERVVAQLEFTWFAPGTTRSVPSGALEMWIFRGGLVAEIRAYYWDTAQLASLARDSAAATT